jgi:hypothetical protein
VWRLNGRKGTPGELTAPATADAARWNGWGTALKPAFEPIVVARKPLTGTVAANVLQVRDRGAQHRRQPHRHHVPRPPRRPSSE